MMESTNSTKLTISSLHVKLALGLAKSLRKNIFPLHCIETYRYRTRTIWRKWSLRSCISWFTLAWRSINRTISCYLLGLWRWYWSQLALKKLFYNKILTLHNVHKSYRAGLVLCKQILKQNEWPLNEETSTQESCSKQFISTLLSFFFFSSSLSLFLFLLFLFVQICVSMIVRISPTKQQILIQVILQYPRLLSRSKKLCIVAFCNKGCSKAYTVCIPARNWYNSLW